jgi:group II intron reverse transcriptase/maturase
MAYGKIYRNAGALTGGVTEDTVEAMALETIDTIIEALRLERYHWKPAKRVYIPKRSGKLRPLGLPVWSDKLLAEVVRLILNAYYDVQFSNHSHGFREERGCHTALRDIYHTWGGATWFIEADLADCFGSLNHELLLSTLAEKIHDGRFLKLIKGLLKAGYLEDWQFHQTLSGVPQGSICSPILSNLLLHKLDSYVETTLIPHYTRGSKRKLNKAYVQRMTRAHSLMRQGQIKAALQLRKQAQRLPSVDPRDPAYRRLKYCRYADDFVLAFTGPKAEAEASKHQLSRFLREELKLTLSEEKTLITHARSQDARFLGYEVTILQKDTKQSWTKAGFKRRSINGHIGLRVPRTVLLDKCRRYTRRGKPTHRMELTRESDFTIISTYQSEYRGVVEYYRLAYNLHTLHRLRWIMEQSLAKTLAHKHRTTVSKIYRKYQTDLVVEGKTYKVLQVATPREGKPPLLATWGGIPLVWDSQAPIEDRPKPKWGNRSELEKRLLAQTCEVCGATRSTERIEVHHLRALKDLNKYEGREKPLWVQIMATRRRKTLVLCHTCHVNLHAGRPLKNKVSRSHTAANR